MYIASTVTLAPSNVACTVMYPFVGFTTPLDSPFATPSWIIGQCCISKFRVNPGPIGQSGGSMGSLRARSNSGRIVWAIGSIGGLKARHSRG